MSLATICRAVAIRVGVQPAPTWAGNPDVTAAEIVEWVNEAQARVVDEYDWQTLVRDASDGVALNEGAVEVVVQLPADFVRLVPDSLWLVERRRRARGPLPAAEWEAVREWAGVPTDPVFTVADGMLLLRPGVALAGGAGAGQLFGDDGLGFVDDLAAPITVDGPGAAPETLAYRYVVAVPPMVSDDQVSVLGAGFERLIILAAEVLYKDSKGLPGGLATAAYMAALASARGDDEPVGVLQLSPRRRMGGAGGRVSVVLDAGRGP